MGLILMERVILAGFIYSDAIVYIVQICILCVLSSLPKLDDLEIEWILHFKQFGLTIHGGKNWTKITYSEMFAENSRKSVDYITTVYQL